LESNKDLDIFLKESATTCQRYEAVSNGVSEYLKATRYAKKETYGQLGEHSKETIVDMFYQTDRPVYIFGLYNSTGRVFFVTDDPTLDAAKSKFVKFLDGEHIDWLTTSASCKTEYIERTRVSPSEDAPFNIDTASLSEFLETDDEFIDLDDNNQVIAYYNSSLKIGMIAKEASCKNEEGVYEELYNRTLFVADDMEAFEKRYEQLKNVIASPAISPDVIISYTVDTLGNILSTIGIKPTYENHTDFYDLKIEYKAVNKYLVILSLELDVMGERVLEASGDFPQQAGNMALYNLNNCMIDDNIIIYTVNGRISYYNDATITVGNKLVTYAYTHDDYYIKDQFGVPVHIVDDPEIKW
jgi:hypothetical protein